LCSACMLVNACVYACDDTRDKHTVCTLGLNIWYPEVFYSCSFEIT
jgi:hypothetical protein